MPPPRRPRPPCGRGGGGGAVRPGPAPRGCRPRSGRGGGWGRHLKGPSAEAATAALRARSRSAYSFARSSWMPRTSLAEALQTSGMASGAISAASVCGGVLHVTQCREGGMREIRLPGALLHPSAPLAWCLPHRRAPRTSSAGARIGVPGTESFDVAVEHPPGDLSRRIAHLPYNYSAGRCLRVAGALCNRRGAPVDEALSALGISCREYRRDRAFPPLLQEYLETEYNDEPHGRCLVAPGSAAQRWRGGRVPRTTPQGDLGSRGVLPHVRPRRHGKGQVLVRDKW